MNLAKRAALEEKERSNLPAPLRTVAIKKTVKIGRPGYRVTKQYKAETQQRCLLFQVRNSKQCWQSSSIMNKTHKPMPHANNPCCCSSMHGPSSTPVLYPYALSILSHRFLCAGTHVHIAQIDYPEIEEGEHPRHRFMSAFEQRKEAWDKAWQYLLFAAEPYEVIAFKIPNYDVDKHDDAIISHWYGFDGGVVMWYVTPQ